MCEMGLAGRRFTERRDEIKVISDASLLLLFLLLPAFLPSLPPFLHPHSHSFLCVSFFNTKSSSLHKTASLSLYPSIHPSIHPSKSVSLGLLCHTQAEITSPMSSPSLMSTLPSPLPFDSLLASSWTWLALCLATIATLLRTLRRPAIAAAIATHTLTGPTLSSPSPPLPPAHHHQRRPCSSPGAGSYGGKGLHRHVGHATCERPLRKKNRWSKSTSSLQKLGRRVDSGGSPSSGLGDLSCFLVESDMPRADSTMGLFLRKASSFLEMCTIAQTTFAQAATTSDLRKLAAMARDCGHKDETVKRLDISETGEVYSLCNWFPSWTYSLLDKLQCSLPVQAQDLPPLFEKQFGWDSYLLTRLGSSWQCSPRSKTVANGSRTIDFRATQHFGLMQSSKYQCNSSSGLTQQTFSILSQQFSSGHKSPVKVWCPQEKKLLKAMDIDESYALALDVGLNEGLVCVGTQGGELALYDIATKSYVNSVFSSPLMPISSVFIGSQNMLALAGGVVRESVNVLDLWDYRSPLYVSTFFIPPERSCIAAMTGFKSKGNQVCVAEANGFMSMYDLRMLNGKPFLRALPAPTEYLAVLNAGSSAWKVGDKKAKSITYLWDKLASNAEDEYWDECQNVLHDGGLTQAGGGGSFMLRCVNLFRRF